MVARRPYLFDVPHVPRNNRAHQKKIECMYQHIVTPDGHVSMAVLRILWLSWSPLRFRELLRFSSDAVDWSPAFLEGRKVIYQTCAILLNEERLVFCL